MVGISTSTKVYQTPLAARHSNGTDSRVGGGGRLRERGQERSYRGTRKPWDLIHTTRVINRQQDSIYLVQCDKAMEDCIAVSGGHRAISGRAHRTFSSHDYSRAKSCKIEGAHLRVDDDDARAIIAWVAEVIRVAEGLPGSMRRSGVLNRLPEFKNSGSALRLTEGIVRLGGEIALGLCFETRVRGLEHVGYVLVRIVVAVPAAVLVVLPPSSATSSSSPGSPSSSPSTHTDNPASCAHNSRRGRQRRLGNSYLGCGRGTSCGEASRVDELVRRLEQVARVEEPGKRAALDGVDLGCVKPDGVGWGRACGRRGSRDVERNERGGREEEMAWRRSECGTHAEPSEGDVIGEPGTRDGGQWRRVLMSEDWRSSMRCSPGCPTISRCRPTARLARPGAIAVSTEYGDSAQLIVADRSGHTSDTNYGVRLQLLPYSMLALLLPVSESFCPEEEAARPAEWKSMSTVAKGAWNKAYRESLQSQAPATDGRPLPTRSSKAAASKAWASSIPASRTRDRANKAKDPKRKRSDPRKCCKQLVRHAKQEGSEVIDRDSQAASNRDDRLAPPPDATQIRPTGKRSKDTDSEESSDDDEEQDELGNEDGEELEEEDDDLDTLAKRDPKGLQEKLRAERPVIKPKGPSPKDAGQGASNEGMDPSLVESSATKYTTTSRLREPPSAPDRKGKGKATVPHSGGLGYVEEDDEEEVPVKVPTRPKRKPTAPVYVHPDVDNPVPHDTTTMQHPRTGLPAKKRTTGTAESKGVSSKRNVGQGSSNDRTDPSQVGTSAMKHTMDASKTSRPRDRKGKGKATAPPHDGDLGDVEKDDNEETSANMFTRRRHQAQDYSDVDVEDENIDPSQMQEDYRIAMEAEELSKPLPPMPRRIRGVMENSDGNVQPSTSSLTSVAPAATWSATTDVYALQGKKPGLKVQSVSLQNLLKAAMCRMQVELVFVNAYADPNMRHDAIIKIMTRDAEELSPPEPQLVDCLKKDMSSWRRNLTSLVDNRLITSRSELRRIVAIHVGNEYGVPTQRSARALVWYRDASYIYPGDVELGNLKTGKCYQQEIFAAIIADAFFRKAGFGMSERHRFVDPDNENKLRIPPPMLAYVATLIHAALRTCAEEPATKSNRAPRAETYENVYRNHLVTIEALEGNQPVRYRHTLRNMYRRATEMADAEGLVWGSAELDGNDSEDSEMENDEDSEAEVIEGGE
ncbi:hypothetical protein PUNSTDRAFT_44661 [Punctularia strigosozonata HHB-11173 SS5]|uniref:uncharacterized protein n=1 Tax=Punctularia strigosozonata (strain HHB-11173) TaxID=741275 RepID=UPI0004417A32|nr:uncharacterized protein PUNSTDRAFT_44661 [Punctularia strigosozonata HHB-11173 SS5]EIN09277.1 hypothetical protein PUNSTDRAFT_44661 [Punctularia strigosozonata HHB-11173 SS5]